MKNFFKTAGLIFFIAAGGFGGDGKHIEGSPLAILICMSIGLLLYFIGSKLERRGMIDL